MYSAGLCWTASEANQLCATMFRRLPEFIRGHPFNRHLEVLLPCHQPPAIESAGNSTYLALQANLCAFLSAEFLEQVIHNDAIRFRAIAVGNGQAAAITPDRMLVLRLPKEAYQRFGLTGQKSAINPGEACRAQKWLDVNLAVIKQMLRSALSADIYVVQVELSSENFTSKGVYYSRVSSFFMLPEISCSFI